MKWDKRKIFAAGFVVLVASVVFLVMITRQIEDEFEYETTYADIGGGQDEFTAANIEWLDIGIAHESLRFEYAGEGLFLLELALGGGLYKYGFMDAGGDIVIPIEFDYAGVFSHGMAYAQADGRQFFIDPTGAEVLDVSAYTSADAFENGFAAVTNVVMTPIEGGMSLAPFRGLIDAAGNEVLPIEFEEAGAFENGVLWARHGGQYALFDSAGNRLTALDFDHLSYAGEGLITAQSGGRFGHLDMQGNVVTPFEFDMVGDFNDGLAFVNLNTMAGYVNTLGEIVIPIQFEAAEAFSEGRAAVAMDGQYGFIDTQGNVVIPFEYDEVWSFSGGVAIVIEIVGRAMTQTSTLDRYGATAIVPETAGFFRWQNTQAAYNNPADGLPGVDFNLMALLSDDGRLLTEFDFTHISEFSGGLAVMQQAGEGVLQYGLINDRGVEILPAMFERVEISGGRAIVQYGGRVGIAVLQ